MNIDPEAGLAIIVNTLFDKKAINIVTLDVRECSTLTDYFVIAEGTSVTHVTALAEAVVSAMKERNEFPMHVEGMKEGDWVVVDFMEIIVHILLPGMRQLYRLEQLWQAGNIVEVPELNISHAERVLI
jgi:ribosome-associated protein